MKASSADRRSCPSQTADQAPADQAPADHPPLSSDLSSPEFVFDGQPIAFIQGETVGSALLRAGIVHLRTAENGDPRGMLCAIGVCWECRCVVDDRPNTRACMTVARGGMVVRRQHGLS